jgi:NAD(P)-dependent dehydrogenase (short-subunit alcohol dehydrogenase family)
MGAVRVTEAFHLNVLRSERRVVAVISTHMASIADIEEPGSYYYRSTKAALNAVMKGISCELRAKGIGLIMLHPGWVRTKMGGQGARLNVTESVNGMMSLVESFSLEKSGRFFRYDGIELPW